MMTRLFRLTAVRARSVDRQALCAPGSETLQCPGCTGITGWPDSQAASYSFCLTFSSRGLK